MIRKCFELFVFLFCAAVFGQSHAYVPDPQADAHIIVLEKGDTVWGICSDLSAKGLLPTGMSVLSCQNATLLKNLGVLGAEGDMLARRYQPGDRVIFPYLARPLYDKSVASATEEKMRAAMEDATRVREKRMRAGLEEGMRVREANIRAQIEKKLRKEMEESARSQREEESGYVEAEKGASVSGKRGAGQTFPRGEGETMSGAAVQALQREKGEATIALAKSVFASEATPFQKVTSGKEDLAGFSFFPEDRVLFYAELFGAFLTAAVILVLYGAYALMRYFFLRREERSSTDALIDALTRDEVTSDWDTEWRPGKKILYTLRDDPEVGTVSVVFEIVGSSLKGHESKEVPYRLLRSGLTGAIIHSFPENNVRNHIRKNMREKKTRTPTKSGNNGEESEEGESDRDWGLVCIPGEK